jgi:hypothetical protein
MRKLGLLIAIGTVACTLDVPHAPIDPPLRSEVPLESDVFRATGSLTHPRAQHAAARLPDGRVLIVGGRVALGEWQQTAEIYDPARETFTSTSPTLARHEAPALTPLRDGRILLSGGVREGFSAILRVELFDPTTERFVAGATGTLNLPEHSATLLEDGRVLLVDAAYELHAEIFDPALNTLARVGAGTFVLGGGTRPAARLGDGRVLFAGGPAPSSGGGQHAYAELFVPATNTFVRTGSMSRARGALTLTALPDGTAVAIGGFQSFGGLRVDVYDSAEIYDPATGVFSAGGTMHAPRASHSATLLASGQVLVIGGGAERYDPRARTFTVTAGAPTVERRRATTTLLRDGRVLIAGGEVGSPSQATTSAELYTPP